MASIRQLNKKCKEKKKSVLVKDGKLCGLLAEQRPKQVGSWKELGIEKAD